MRYRIGQGYDVHKIASGLDMFLCGVKIDSPFGFVAHSDGDVAIHSLCDALLGAAALGDIGHLFPDTDSKYKGISSLLLLEEVVRVIKEKGYSIENVDITIALQAPKIAHYILSMRQKLSQQLAIDLDCVSVKATTSEKLGFVGRQEGCEVWAICLLSRE